MRTLFVRSVFRTLVAGVLVLGLAGPATATIPFTIDTNDGYTFSGVTNSEEVLKSFDCPVDANGNPIVGFDGVPGTADDLCQLKQSQVIFTDQGTIGPLTVNGTHQPNFSLDWSRAKTVRVPNCNPTEIAVSTSNSVVNQVVVHHTADLSQTPGNITQVDVVIPTIDNAGIGTTTPFPISALGVEATVTRLDMNGIPIELVALSLQSVSPMGGEAARFHGMLVPPPIPSQ